MESVKIKEKTSDAVITEEVLVFKTVIKNKIAQECLHRKISSNELLNEIISGPAKNTVISIKFNEIENGTRVDVNINLKLSLKEKILEPLIKKVYKQILTAMFYKLNTVALEDQN